MREEREGNRERIIIIIKKMNEREKEGKINMEWLKEKRRDLRLLR